LGNVTGRERALLFERREVGFLSELPKIGMREAIGLLTIFLLAKAFLPYLVFMIHWGLSGTWLMTLIHVPIGVAGVLVLVWLLQRHPGKSIVEIGESLVGPALNIVFAFIIVTFLVMKTGFELRQFAEFLLTAFLIETPISVVVLTFVLAMVVVAYLGVDILGRVAWIYFLPFLFGLAVLLAMTVNLWEGHGLYPLLGPGLWGMTKGVLVTLGVGSDIILLGVIAPFLVSKTLRVVGVVSVIVAGTVVSLIITVTLLVFPFPIAHEFTLPIFEVSRAINLGRFLVRLETLFLPLWMFAGLISMTAGLYAAAAVTARGLKMPYYRPFIFPMAVLVIAVSFIFPNISAAMRISFELLATWSVVPIGLIIGTLVGLEYWRARTGPS
jgi:spore germination protein (amino acid permease)